MEFIYDTTGVAGFKYKDSVYFYRKDVQGNIIAILDNAGNVVVKYDYGAWGKHVVSGGNIALGNINPFRYRGYYYDSETQLYYLQTRYYDPETGRFISQDNIDYADPETINGLNLYAYCANNPVMNVDPTGTSFTLFALLIGLIIGTVAFTAAGATAAGVIAAQNGATGWELVGQIFLGAAFGFAIAGVAMMFLAPIFGATGLVASVTASRIFSIGAAMFNILPMVVAPIIGVTSMEPIEYKPNPFQPITMPPNIIRSVAVKNIIIGINNSRNLNYDKISRETFARLQKLVFNA